MQLLLPVALLVSAVAAQSTACGADYIVEACLSSETAKFSNCATTDYDCQCAAQQAIATCYNNCPNDPRAGTAAGQVQIYCQNASLYGSAAKASKTAAPGAAGAASTAAPNADATVTRDSNGPSQTSSRAPTNTPNVGAGELALNTGGVLLAVAGVMAAVL